MDDEQSARLIGNSLPTIKDGLLNIIQLSVSADSGLAVASIQQKSKEFEPVSFDSVIHLSQNKKYLKYLAIPVGLILLLMIFNQAIITQSTNRIVNFNQKFSPQAPFKFVVQNKLLTGFFNEDFVLKISLEGSAIPDAAYLTMGSQNLKMENLGNGSFQYVFGKTEDLAEFGRVSRGSVLLTLAGSLDDMSLARQVIPQTVDLSVMVLERHPIPAEDRQIEALCRLWPFHMRLGYFLALDDAVQCRCIHPTTVVLLQQLGLRDHELITSHMLTQRIETVLTREALQNKSQRPAESPEQWFALNRS